MHNLRIDAFISGAEKAATTSLGYYLEQHPRIHSHFRKSENNLSRMIEFSIFQDDKWKNKKIFKKYYLEAFGKNTNQQDKVVAKNVDVLHRNSTAKNLFLYAPNCKIIVVLRNPVDRAFSSFCYQRYRGVEPLDDFEDAICQELSGNSKIKILRDRQYISKGVYYDQVKNLFDTFGRENVLVVFFTDLKLNPVEVLNCVFVFLNLSEFDVKAMSPVNAAKKIRSKAVANFIGGENFIKTVFRHLLSEKLKRKVIHMVRGVNSTESDKLSMSIDTRNKLIKYYRPHNARLSELLDCDLSHWDQ
jgi:hypothetical protein